MSLLTPEPVELCVVEAAFEKEGESEGERGGVAASMQGEGLQHMEDQQHQRQEGLQLAAHPSKAPAEADEGAGASAPASVASFKSPTLFKSAFTGKLWRSEDLPGGGTSHARQSEARGASTCGDGMM